MVTDFATEHPASPSCAAPVSPSECAAAPARERSKLPPSSTFPATPVSASLALVNVVGAALDGMQTSKDASGRTISSGWAAMIASSDDAAPAAEQPASSQRLLAALCQGRSPAQHALLHVAWQTPGLATVAEQQLLDLVGAVQQLRADVLQLLEEEAQSDGYGAVSAPADAARVDSMVQHLLSAQRPDLRTTCVEHLLAHASSFNKQQAALVNEQNEAAGQPAAASASGSSPRAEPTAASLSLQQALAESCVKYYKDSLQLVKSADQSTQQQYEVSLSCMQRIAATVSAAAQKLQAAAQASPAPAPSSPDAASARSPTPPSPHRKSDVPMVAPPPHRPSLSITPVSGSRGFLAPTELSKLKATSNASFGVGAGAAAVRLRWAADRRCSAAVCRATWRTANSDPARRARVWICTRNSSASWSSSRTPPPTRTTPPSSPRCRGREPRPPPPPPARRLERRRSSDPHCCTSCTRRKSRNRSPTPVRRRRRQRQRRQARTAISDHAPTPTRPVRDSQPLSLSKVRFTRDSPTQFSARTC